MERELKQKIALLEFHPKLSICFISKGHIVSVPIDEITHISKYGSETLIYTSNCKYKTYHSLQQLQNDLPVNDFFRTHRSHIVSLLHMNGVKKRKINVGEYYLPLSKYYKLQLLVAMERILNNGYKTLAIHENRIPTIAQGHVAGHRKVHATGASRKGKGGVKLLDSQ